MRALNGGAPAAGSVPAPGRRAHLHLIWPAEDQLRRGTGSGHSHGRAGAAATTADGNQKRGATVMAQPTRSDVPEPVRDGLGATIMGPRNVALERQNPNLLASPYTDAGTIPNLKFSFSDARNRLLTGGWAREVTARELPVATTLAGVNMRLKPGAIRELHWHKEAEWAYMLAGHARITAIDPDGHNFIDDLGTGDLWNFRAGLPHSIQALADGCEFLLVFDDGMFSENETFLLTDWFDHTPLTVLAKNLGVSESALTGIPKDPAHERYIFSGEVPPPLAQDVVRAPAGKAPMSMTYRLLEQEPVEVPGGRVRIVDSSNFPAANTIAAALVELDQGAMRELHWHPTNDEWQYYISGQGQMTVFASSGKARTFDYRAGDVGYVPFAMGHYVLNTGDQPLRFLEMFRSSRYADVSLNQWLALTPPELVQAHLNLDQSTTAAITGNKAKPIIVR
jgi:oxalate decarboxylase